MLFAEEALDLLLTYKDVKRILDVGSGEGHHAAYMSREGRNVTTVNLKPPANFVGDYLSYSWDTPFDAVWVSHVLEHQQNVGLFLQKCFRDLRDDGVLAVTVPPPKHAVVGGHLNLFNGGTLLYNLILAGFDCAHARVKSYGYNISVVVRKKKAKLPSNLEMDAGDLEKLAHFFPIEAKQGFDGWITEVNW